MVQKWDEIVESFREHFNSSDVEKGDGEIEYRGGSSKFLVSSSGYVEGSMPLHSFISESYDRIVFEEDHVKVFCRDVIYEFRQ